MLRAETRTSGVSLEEPDVEVYVREGCPHCVKAERFLQRLSRERPELRIRVLDVSRDAEAAARLSMLARTSGAQAVGVPAFYVAGRLIIGFSADETTGAAVLRALNDPRARRAVRQPGAADGDLAFEVPLLGEVSVRALGLPAFTVALGLLDGFNPCAMWALMLVLSLLVNLENRAKILILGGTFVAVGGLVYFAFMAAWLEVFFAIGLSRPLQVALGAVALTAGLINLADGFALDTGVGLRIPRSARPRIYSAIRRVLTADNLAAAMVAVVMLSLTVNIVELACTAGLPALYTQLLTARALPRSHYYGYLALYNTAYVLDDAIVLTIAVVTLDRRKLGSRGGAWLKLVSGAVLAGLGLLLIAAPQWLF